MFEFGVDYYIKWSGKNFLNPIKPSDWSNPLKIKR